MIDVKMDHPLVKCRIQSLFLQWLTDVDREQHYLEVEEDLPLQQFNTFDDESSSDGCDDCIIPLFYKRSTSDNILSLAMESCKSKSTWSTFWSNTLQLPRFLAPCFYNQVKMSIDNITTDPMESLFNILKSNDRDYLVHSDLYHLIEYIVDITPFLKSNLPDMNILNSFVEFSSTRFYFAAEQVIGQVVDIDMFKKCGILEVMYYLDQHYVNNTLELSTETIPPPLRISNFNVLYKKYINLRKDSRRGPISRRQFARYDEHSYTNAFLDRLFDPVLGFLKNPPLMNFSEFLRIIFLEEDKTTYKSLCFWFRFLDIDHDDEIKMAEIAHFWRSIESRVHNKYDEDANITDTICILNDLLTPKIPGVFTLDDLLKANPASRLLPDMLLNVKRYIETEQLEYNQYSNETMLDTFLTSESKN